MQARGTEGTSPRTGQGVGMLKTGAQHVQSLRDGRHVYIDGGCVADVVAHPGFRGAIRTVGELYDFVATPENCQLMTFESPGSAGERVNRIWQLPKSYGDLVERRHALEAWSEL